VTVDVSLPTTSPSREGRFESPLSGGDLGVGSSKFVKVCIRDTGAGIPADHVPHIFDRFYQTGDNYAKDSQGSGIGLALTKELVELHHGEIEVSSEVGKGTVFTVRLLLGKDHLKPGEILPPLKVDDSTRRGEHKGDVSIPVSPEEIIEERVELSLNDAPSSSKHETIALIVEDNPDMRTYIRELLVQSYEIVEATNGQEGFEKAAEIIPDIIISDVMMPEMDGFQFCEKIKTDQRTSHIPVILLTAKSSGESKVEGLETGADDYLTKPFDAHELRVRVKNLIEQRERLRERFQEQILIHPSAVTATSMDSRFLKRAIAFVEEHLDDTGLDVNQFSKEMALSRSQLNRKLRALTKQSATEFIRCLRLKRAAQLLEHHSGNISEIAYEVGFTNPSRFAEYFRKLFGVSPSKYVSQ
jgi:DNA-binding response OmpR family regulator